VLLKFIEECNRLLLDGTADSARCMGSARIAYVPEQCLYENCPQMIEKEPWPPINTSNLNDMEISCRGATHEAILKPSSEAKCDNLPQVQLTKLSRVFLTNHVKDDGRHVEFLSTQKSVRTSSVCAVVNSLDNF